MTKHSFEKALAEWPQTAWTRDGGIHVTGRYQAPMYKIWRGTVFVIALLAALSIGSENQGAGTMIGFVAFVLCFVFGKRLFGRKLDIKIYRDRIALPGWFGYRNYSRQMPIEFRVEQHHWAIKERGNSRTYREAIEAVMQYGEKRIPIAAMREEHIEMARALVIRLQNACDGIDAAVEMAAQKAGLEPRNAGAFGPAPDIR